MEFTRQQLKQLETIEQSHSGDELKIDDDGVRVWLTCNENRSYDGDYQVEIRIDGKWHTQCFLDGGEGF